MCWHIQEGVPVITTTGILKDGLLKISNHSLKRYVIRGMMLKVD
jgi:hypothetical protein